MRIFLSESLPDYSSYTFNYALYCVQEDKSEMSEIYAKGFLPYTGNPALKSEVYYLARSLRVNLANFKDTSENRRVARKIEELNITLKVINKTDFDLENPTFVKFCTEYAAERFHDGSMSAERFLYVANRENASHIFEFKNEEKVLGYVLAVMNDAMLHYWYAFFDTEYLRSHSLGKWMMWKVISWAQKHDLQHVYLGTCYGEHALYKIRDFKGLEYWDGNQWRADVKRLKTLCKSDKSEQGRTADLFKMAEDQNEALREFTNKEH